MTRWLFVPVVGSWVAATALHPAAGLVAGTACCFVWLAGARRIAVAVVIAGVLLAGAGLTVDAADRASRVERHRR